ncbi:hypothetical protein TFLX_05431 [Thermoflexales bacterium]|nr:hypothetical protein TFLX_05431 [Thermoflexales bacterium]
MNTHNKLFAVGIVSLAVLAVLAAAARFTYAQGAEPGALVSIEPGGVSESMPGAIGVQGKLTDASGNPLTGDYGITFRLYDTVDGTLALCSDSNTVAVQNGLFNSYIDNCYNDLWGQKVWLGVQVGSDAEMTPRQVIYPVAYALTLRPGALISGTLDGILTINGTGGDLGTDDYDAFSAYAKGGGEAVQARALNGFGVYATSETNVAIEGFSHNTTSNIPAILGCVNADDGICNTYDDNNPAGVTGVSTRGDGMQGYTTDLGSRGLYAENEGGGIAIVANSASITSAAHLYPSLYLIQGTTGADFVVGASTLYGTRYWRVDRTGKGFFNGGTQASGADFAEQIVVADDAQEYAPGDVLVISADTDRAVELSNKAYSTAVIGVYSTQPGYLAGAPDTDEALGGLPVAIVGIVPCKVSAENGAIHRGDLLVTSATPGHAMRAGADPAQGTVLGKALGELKDGTGVIQILVTLQ